MTEVSSLRVVSLNIKDKTIKILKDNEKNVFVILHGQKFLKQSTKSTNCKGKFDKLKIKLATFVAQKIPSREEKGKSQAGRRCLQYI